jgi:hypothetical protein
MPKPKYFELILPPGKDIPTYSMAGYSVVSDYVSDGNRHLFFRKPESSAAPKTRKQRTKKTAGKDAGPEVGGHELP